MTVSWSFANRIPPGSRSSVGEGESLHAGQRFGPYEVLAPLGAGASSRVYRVRGPEGELALKVLKTSLGEDARERFRREGRLAAGLAHAGIVRLIDGGEVEGRPYLAYELVDSGESFWSWVERRDLRARVRALRQVAEALGHAHRRGVLHRDLKPANVLVAKDGAIKLTDFGLGVGGDLERMTRSGTLVGTPRTMSPEQLSGARDLTPASDVWSLGVMLYTALTGRHPFAVEGLVRLRERIASAAPAAPRSLNPELPQRLERVVLRALQRAPESRFPDAGLLAQALAVCEAEVPETPGPSLPRPRSAGSSTMRLPLPLGPHEPFELLEVIGHGAMGVVYRARDPLQREVAVKAIRGAPETRRLERFRREGELTANLVHDNVLKVHGTGVLGQTPYLIYELVPGARTLDEATLSLDRSGRLRLLRDAARGLGHAHQQGVVHRDIKPDNLLVGEDGRVRVADFGLAAAQGLERLTRSGALVGTPHYMAPELVAGDRAAVGPPTDVWALGVILFRLLTEELPFPADTLVELAASVTSATQAPSPRALDPSLPSALDAICRRALEPDPTRRYPDASEFAADLEAFLEGRASRAEARGGAGRRGLLGLGALGALAVVLALGAGAAWLGGSEQEQPRVEAPTTTLEETAGEADARAKQAWEAALAQSNPRAQVAAARTFRREFSRHPLAAEAQAFLRERRYAYRIATLLHADSGSSRTLGAFRGAEVLTVAQDERLVRWSLGGERLGQRLLRDFPQSRTSPGVPAAPDSLAAWADGVAIGVGHEPLYFVPDEGEPYRDARYLASDLKLAPDGVQLGIATRGGQIVLLPTDRSALTARLLGELRHVARHLEFSPRGRYLIAASAEDNHKGITGLVPAELKLWELESGAVLFDYATQGVVRSMAFSLDERTVFVGESTGRVVLLETRTGEPVRDMVLDGRGTQRGDELRAPCAHRGSVKAMALSPARILYSCGKDGSREGFQGVLRVWDAKTGRPLLPEIPLTGEPEQAEISADGTLLLLSLDNAPAELWGIDVVDVD